MLVKMAQDGARGERAACAPLLRKTKGASRLLKFCPAEHTYLINANICATIEPQGRKGGRGHGARDTALRLQFIFCLGRAAFASRAAGAAGGGVRRSGAAARRDTGQERAGQAAGRQDRRDDSRGAAQVPGAGAAQAAPRAVRALLPRHKRDIRPVHRPGGGGQRGRELPGRDGLARAVRHGREHSQRAAGAGEARNGADHIGGRVVQQDVRQAGQRLQKARRHHRHNARQL